MVFKSFLSAVGHEGKVIFAWMASSKGQAAVATVEGSATAIVSAFNPAAGLALAGVEDVINAGLKQVVSTEALAVAAEQQSGTGAQKASAVVTSISPQVAATLQTLGVAQPAAAQVQSIAEVIATSLANIVNAFPAPVAPETPATPSA